jgi:hypothetical protein
VGELVFLNASVEINSVDLSDHVRSLTLNYGAEIFEITAMQDLARRRIAGLVDWSMDVEFNQDFDAASVDATLFPLVGAAAFAIAVRPDAAVVGATNPEFQGNGLLESYPPLAGGVSEVLTASCTIQGTGLLTRAVA